MKFKDLKGTDYINAVLIDIDKSIEKLTQLDLSTKDTMAIAEGLFKAKYALMNIKGGRV